jgi:hypothetical protein
MRGAFTMRFQPEVAEFVQVQARAENRSGGISVSICTAVHGGLRSASI